MKRIALITISILCAVMLQAQDIKQFIDSILSVGKYAISHSPEYREAYRPHYRIVERSIFEREILPQIEQKTMIVRIAEIEVYPQYLKDYLSLNLLDIQPLDAAAMPMIFRKQQ